MQWFHGIWASRLCGVGQCLQCLWHKQCGPGPRCMHEEAGIWNHVNLKAFA